MCKQIKIKVVDGLTCPKCGNGEVHPTLPDKILIRAFKVDMGKGWESQCLVCSGYYDKELNETPANHNGNKGWFL